jgi:hypothetical protein
MRLQQRKIGAAVTATWLIVALVGTWGYAAPPVSEQACAQFSLFSQTLTDDTPAEPTMRRAPSWVQVSNGRWVQTLDVAGNRCFRPVDTLTHMASTWSHAADRNHEIQPLDETTRAQLVRRTRELALRLAGVSPDAEARVHAKRETILLRGPERLEQFAGRYLVRLDHLPNAKHFQVVYSPDRRPIRIDTNVCNPATTALTDALDNQSPEPGIAAYSEDRGPLALGTFFDPGEYRFELRAYAFEGEPFLEPLQHRDPFGRDHFDVAHAHLVDIEAYRLSKDYRHWCWHWWSMYGRVGAARGNRLPDEQRWEHARVELRHHRNLATYKLIGGEPQATNDIKQSDGKTYTYPFAERARIEPDFYRDLEDCHVAYLTTHGGHVENRYRFRRGLDVWVEFLPPQKLGSGNLRHLFIDGCGGMTHLAEPDKQVLLRTWIDRGQAGGIRTICGADGGHTGLDRSGWRFFGRYNKGDAISDAWALRDMDENPDNNPVTAAFGPTRAKALDTLFHGQFSRHATRPEWAAVSIWTNP